MDCSGQAFLIQTPVPGISEETGKKHCYPQRSLGALMGGMYPELPLSCLPAVSEMCAFLHSLIHLSREDEKLSALDFTPKA